MAEAAPPVTWCHSRRLTGPSLLLDTPGAVLEASCPLGREDELIARWRAQVQIMLEAVGWRDAAIAVRAFLGGASLAVAAPIDGLYAATLVNEWACDAAASDLAGTALPPLESAAATIRREIAADCDPALFALAEAAARCRVAFIQGDRHVSVGLGAGSITWYYD
jgi:cyanophycin synthetase